MKPGLGKECQVTYTDATLRFNSDFTGSQNFCRIANFVSARELYMVLNRNKVSLC